MSSTPCFSKILALATVAVACSVNLHGQATPAPTPTTATQPPEKKIPVTDAPKKADWEQVDDELLVLSPFEVNAKNDSGYSAGSSLAGNRLNTDLRDVASAVSVVTAQMLKDIGATSNETLLQYTTNTEVGNIYGNMANAGSGTLLDENSKFLNPNQNTRVRGLTSADSTVDYFLTDSPWDSYNVDRVDFQRGPNAILFGLGSPSGIINAGTKSAGFKNKGQVELRYSRFGSVRSTLDLNHVLIDKELAFRIDVLSDKQKFQQTPAFQDDKRIYGTIRYEPGFLNNGSAHTTIKVNFEQGTVRSNRPRTLTPGDGITPWFLTGTSTGYDAVGNPYQYNNLNHQGFDARGLLDGNFAGLPTKGQQVQTVQAVGGPGSPVKGSLNPYWQPWLGGQFAASSYGNPTAIFSNGSLSANTLIAPEAGTQRGLNSAGAIDKNIGGIPYSRMSSITLYRDISKKVNLPGAKFGLTRSITMTDPTVFDFYNNMLDGPNKWEWQNFNHFDANLAQTFLKGDVGFEAVYDKQHYDNGQMTFMSARSLQLYVDVIETLSDGTKNPNFGRPFIADDGTGGNASISDRASGRFTAFAKHDFAKGHSSWLTRLLGKHTITGLYNDSSQNTSWRSFVHYVADNGFKDFQNGYPSGAQSIDSTVRKVQPIIYIGNSLKDPSITSASGFNIPAPTVQATVNGGSIRAFDSTWNAAATVLPSDPWVNPLFPAGDPRGVSTQSENPANYRGWINTPITITDSEKGNRDQNTNNASKNRNTVTSKAMNWQGYFWDNAFVVMYGYREDTAKNWSVSATKDAEGRPLLDPQTFIYPANNPLTVAESSNSWSGVFHLNKLLKERLPINVSFFFNKSENFQPLAGRVSLYNNPLPPPTGKTKEYGIRLSTKDEKYAVKFNLYETKIMDANTTSGFGQQWVLGQLFTQGQNSRNQYVFEVSNPADPLSYHNGNANQWTYSQALGQTPADAAAAQSRDIAGWDALVRSLSDAYVKAWSLGKDATHDAGFNQNAITDLHTFNYTQPSNLTVTEDNVSKGMELELYAQPTHGLRLTANASKSTATRTNVGDATWNTQVNMINTMLNTTSAGSLRLSASDPSATTLAMWNSNFWATWLSAKGQENSAVPELRKWRANVIVNYDFDRGLMKGINIGAGVRWQDKVIIGYTPRYYVVVNGEAVESDPWHATLSKFDLSKPYYGPSETNVDLWIGYSHRISKDLNWRTQINVRNVGKRDSLIPITTQPDGTVAAWRIAPTMVWSLTNSIEF